MVISKNFLLDSYIKSSGDFSRNLLSRIIFYDKSRYNYSQKCWFKQFIKKGRKTHDDFDILQKKYSIDNIWALEKR